MLNEGDQMPHRMLDGVSSLQMRQYSMRGEMKKTFNHGCAQMNANKPTG